ncbi:MAG: hypothetical protein KKC39_01965 [Candidatus Omnitrophica bacterium]|nr:hypothetical protein [Candidatus Omnitrophota bacterium]MBU4467499.1 hypothetical protein [Candidatus Omnitrophota bacterium]MCG2713302.1 hypothetical protein [Candidatus Omnitrophota bacterium]
MAYFNKKAQTLTELATFGSILLLVLSFLISYGVRYNYQQDMQMAAFRTALSEAYNGPARPDASASVVLLKDKHIPDPRDMFGAGSVVPVQASAEVIWGNTLQDKYTDLTDYSTLPRKKYVINGKEYEYRTAGFGFITSPANQFYVMFPNNPDPQLLTWNKLRCYQPTEDSPKQAMILLNPEAADADKQKEIISEVYLKWGGISFVKYQVIGVGPDSAVNGDLLTRLNLLSPDSGEINPNYTQLNNDVNNDGIPDVTPANIQGLLLEDEQNIRRSGKLTIEETPGTSASTAAYSFKDEAGNPTTITHKIRSRSGVENINSPFERNRVSEWKITK